MTNVMESEDDDDENEPTSQEEALQMGERLNDRRVLLASFLKMAMFSVIDNKLVAPIWAQYIRVSDISLVFVNMYVAHPPPPPPPPRP